MNTTSIFFNQSFDKKRLKVFLYWILKTFGEKEALIVVEQLKSMGFYNATKAGLSIGLHDLKTPSNKRFLISDAQVTMRKTDQEFQGAEVTATERSQRIVDTWHRTSEDLRKQVVNYFSTYDQLNSVYMMALSGARGNFSQVRQLIGMRGLMADPQGQIISFPIRSNLREGLTLTEYFISCSGARKGLVDTALRTADTGYLTRRLVDISHHIVVKKVTCYTARGVALKTLRTPQKILLPLRERLVGRVLAETIYGQKGIEHDLKQEDLKCSVIDQNKIALFEREERQSQRSVDQIKPRTHLNEKITKQAEPISIKEEIIARKNQEISADLALKISFVKEELLDREKLTHSSRIREDQNKDYKGVNSKGSSQITDTTVPQVLVRSPLTCTYTHEICQLCYGWSMAQGTLVSLGEAVGVIAGQSIGEPGTQLTMRTFHTGGVFSGDLLQEIRAPHSGRILFPKALQGLLVRTSQGKVAFLIKVSGEVLVDATDIDDQIGANKTTRLQLEPSTILFVRQGERVKSHQILAELAITSQEGNQPIKTRQTLFSEIDGRIVQWKSMTTRVHRTKSVQREIKHNQAFLCKNKAFVSQNFSSSRNKNSFPYQVNTAVLEKKKSDSSTTPGIQTYLGPVEAVPNSLYSILDLSSFSNQVNPVSYQNLDIPWFLQQFAEDHAQSYEETWDHLNNPTLKKIALAKKHGLGAIEPPQAVNLGLLSVIATRIGASEKTYTKLPFFNKADLESPNLRTVVIKNKLKNSLYFKKKNNQKLTNITNLLESQSKNFIGGFTKQSFFNKESVTKIVAQRFLQLHTHMDHLQHLNTVAEQGDLVDEDYAQVYCDPLSR